MTSAISGSFITGFCSADPGTAAKLGVVTLSGAGRRGVWRRRGLFRVGHRPPPASLSTGSSPITLRPPILRQSPGTRHKPLRSSILAQWSGRLAVTTDAASDLNAHCFCHHHKAADRPMATRKTPGVPSKVAVAAKGARSAEPSSSPTQLDLDFTGKITRSNTPAPPTSSGTAKKPKRANKGKL